jgi:hypothetical protein
MAGRCCLLAVSIELPGIPQPILTGSSLLTRRV